VNFKNTIIIMTSNLGSHLIQEKFEKINFVNHDEIVEEAKNQVLTMLKQTIRPEFLNRIDEIIMFTPLNENEIKDIVRLQLSSVTKMLKEAGITLEVTDKAIDFIASEGFDPEFGARPVKRAIQRYLLNDLSKKILAGSVDRNEPVIVDSDNNTLVYRN
jgi:ATP-dependent Clp protease ATP-binding subunit ClpB